MRIGDLSGGSAQLNDSLDSLRTAWAETATRWDDPTSRRLYKERLEPLEPISRKALSAIQRLTEVLAKAERDCSDE
jgi:hypothetical protein